MKKVIILASIQLAFALNANVQAQEQIVYTSTKVVNAIDPNNGVVTYTFQVTTNGDGSFGYDILANGKVYFHQPYYPGRTTGFSDKRICESIAKMIIMKLERPVSPPMISDRELKAYGVQ
ncbi:hypothetical protein DBR32_03630 [Taibaiella sp. KBW10]|uniref:DUF4907 domain-containing protein n=1 Tax=Taibaiella sp. KBW10 TaxID=2153357 RepID=UPI000F5A1D5D|nr:DUF4907 domain-containing protein [Taibaiella sp. KBW10]RQO31908.1 hypothetical protein DBR32_03630 [Taibaiella sp. KBW10]